MHSEGRNKALLKHVDVDLDALPQATADQDQAERRAAVDSELVSCQIEHA